jgi:uncharacterized protein with HEPN domain
MDHKINAWLFDILKSIDEIESFFNRILKVNPDFKIENSRNIVGTRNRIIHSYDNISDDMI